MSHGTFDEETEENTRSVCYTVEATSFEDFCLWQQWNGKIKWKQVTLGWWQQIGAIDNRPITVSVSFAKLGSGEAVVAFWDCMSQLRDMKMAEEWVRKTFKNAVGHTNASNFPHAIQFIRGEWKPPMLMERKEDDTA